MIHRSKPVPAVLTGIALATLTLVSAQAQTATPPDSAFRVATTGDLAQLCEASPTDPTGIAALHFCHGFAVGAYRYHQIAAAASGRPPLFCEPDPRPTRDQATAAFVAWARQHPERMDTQPVEGLFEFLAQTYPCRG